MGDVRLDGWGVEVVVPRSIARPEFLLMAFVESRCGALAGSVLVGAKVAPLGLSPLDGLNFVLELIDLHRKQRERREREAWSEVLLRSPARVAAVAVGSRFALQNLAFLRLDVVPVLREAVLLSADRPLDLPLRVTHAPLLVSQLLLVITQYALQPL